MLTIPALTILSKFDILNKMIKLITYLINRLTEFREYLIKRSIPKSQTPQQWADGYKKWQSEQRKYEKRFKNTKGNI